MGLRRISPDFRTVCYVEVEAFACANLVAKIEAGKLDAAPIWTDIKTFPAEIFRGKVHGITGGYPCQPFSHAGKRQGTDDERHLWPHIARIVQAVRPIWCFFENVAGHLTLGFPEVYRSLRDLGYSVEAGLFSASECGAPHRRERLFIMAYNENSRFSGSNISIRQPQRQKQTKINAVRFSEMADPTSPRFQQGYKPQEGQTARCNETLWPSRPGEPQYKWEEPRVVGDAKCRDDTGGELRIQPDRTKSLNTGCKTPKRARQAQSELGRATARAGSRVDRLRLLGNGCVPQTVELAFRTLMSVIEGA